MQGCIYCYVAKAQGTTGEVMRIEIEQLSSMEHRALYRDGYRYRVRVWCGQYMQTETLHATVQFAKYDVDFQVNQIMNDGVTI